MGPRAAVQIAFLKGRLTAIVVNETFAKNESETCEPATESYNERIL